MANSRRKSVVEDDRARFVRAAKRLLTLPTIGDWDRKFLTSLISGDDYNPEPPAQLSIRQDEQLDRIRAEYELFSTLYGGFNIQSLIEKCYHARLDLSEDDEEWITGMYQQGVSKLNRGGCGRLRRCAVQLGEIEPYMDDVA